jgi:hypothetical protein
MEPGQVTEAGISKQIHNGRRERQAMQVDVMTDRGCLRRYLLGRERGIIGRE